MSNIAVVINPIAGAGRGKKIWQVLKPDLNAVFDTINYRISNRVHDIGFLTQELLAEEPDYLLIIGGDGTLNLALNGILEQDKLKTLKTKFAFFNVGSGGDFIRQFPRQKITEFLDRLSRDQFVISNIGKIIFPNQSSHYFINIASCGLSGQVVLATSKNRWLNKLGGTINYFFHSISGLFAYRSTDVRIKIDELLPIECSLLLMAVCNGQYFGGRMRVAPLAKIDDDLLDVVLFRDFTKLCALLKLYKIYSGSHILDKNVHYVRAKKVSIEPLDNRIIHVEADGERIGQLPVTFEILKETISIIV